MDKFPVYHVFPARIKLFQASSPVTNALKIQKVKNQIRPNVIPVVMAQNQNPVVLDVPNVMRAKRVLA